MALAYDFDIFDVIPDSGSTDPQLDGFLSRAGFAPGRDLATVALFRDPLTAQALRDAPPGLRDYFLASGFGLNTYASGAPPGRYPARDEAARLALIQRLADNAPHHTLPRSEDSVEGGDVFRLEAFLAALDECEPIKLTGSNLPDHSARPLPPVFEHTDPIATQPPDADIPSQRRKFWQSRFFRLGAAAALVLAVMQLASGPALTVLASL
ncbi:hypothetical protein [Pseudotabrizicola sp. 4114]|uniref:hypothetical protein n=1 Tax=Pseudotabrizicola sp. 4114 TaxID=2817731 RepID=UPI0028669555|nr:hypothetical protein [Pseudorhodobacter sp. 4114]